MTPPPASFGPAPEHLDPERPGAGGRTDSVPVAVLAQTSRLDPPDVGPAGLLAAPVEWARVPRVNLLPAEIIEARRFRRHRRVLAGVVAGVTVLCGLGTVWAQTGVSSARSMLEITRNETLALQRQQAQFAEVPKVSAELDAARAARERALGSDVLWYRFLTDLAVNTPEGTALSSVMISLSGAPAPSAAGQPRTAAGLGTVKVTGEANRFPDVAAWLDAAAGVNGLTGTTLQSAVRSDGGSGSAGRITYSGGAIVSSAALSHRYDRKAS